MPPQDSQTIVGTSCDNKIKCAKDDDHAEEEEREVSEHDPIPESFWLSKDAELDWFDRNAFLDRKDSTKANQNHNSVSNPSSQRFSKSKTSIIGLPKPQQKPCLVDARHRRNHTNSRLFPKRGAEPMAEPSSPKVSCMGRVKSRNRRLKNRQRSLKSDKPTIERRKKKGLWKNLRSIFRSGPGHKPVTEPGSQETTRIGHVLSRDLSSTATLSVVVGLGGMTRFSSGRRSDGWVGEVAEIRSGLQKSGSKVA